MDQSAKPTSSTETKANAQISSTAENVFGGRSGATSLNCNNLSSNPFSPFSSTGGGGILAKPKFSLKPASIPAPTSSTSSVTTSLDSGDASSSTVGTATNSNPFLRPAKLSYDNSDEAQPTVASSNDNESSAVKSDATSDSASKEAAPVAPQPESSNTEVREVKASGSDMNMSLASSSSQPPKLGVNAGDGFTFGQNIAARANQVSFVFGEKLDDRVTNAVKENGTNGHNPEDGEAQKPKIKTLEEAAEEYKKQQESGPLLPEVETVTGEESESNVLQVNCKLFLFDDKQKTWAEKGRGVLRLNDDSDGTHARIVMRTASIHRVILNTSIWGTMVCERAGPKSIRITGTELEQVHVYLISGSQSDIDHLHSAVTCRIQKLKRLATTSTAADSGAASSESSTSSKRKPEDDTEKEETSPNKKQRHDDAEPTSTSTE